MSRTDDPDATVPTTETTCLLKASRLLTNVIICQEAMDPAGRSGHLRELQHLAGDVYGHTPSGMAAMVEALESAGWDLEDCACVMLEY